MVLCLTEYIFFSVVRPGACGRSFGRSAAVEGFPSGRSSAAAGLYLSGIERDRKPFHPYDRRLRSTAGPSPASDSTGKCSHSTDLGCHPPRAPFSAGADRCSGSLFIDVIADGLRFLCSSVIILLKWSFFSRLFISLRFFARRPFIQKSQGLVLKMFNIRVLRKERSMIQQELA